MQETHGLSGPDALTALVCASRTFITSPSAVQSGECAQPSGTPSLAHPGGISSPERPSHAPGTPPLVSRLEGRVASASDNVPGDSAISIAAGSASHGHDPIGAKWDGTDVDHTRETATCGVPEGISSRGATQRCGPRQATEGTESVARDTGQALIPIGRLAVQSLGAPAWKLGVSMEEASHQLLRTVFAIKGAVRDSRSAAMVSIPAGTLAFSKLRLVRHASPQR